MIKFLRKLFPNINDQKDSHEQLKDLIGFLNSQEPYIKNFNAIHIGFFESNKGISFYVTGAPESKVGTDDHCFNESFPLPLNRYWSLKATESDPFIFAESIKNEIERALKEKKLSESYQSAELLTFGGDDYDLEYIKAI